MDEFKASRLIFYKDDIDQIEKVIDEFIKKSDSKCSILIDKDGHLVTNRGQSMHFDPETLSALVAGSFAATREMAKLLGEMEFTVLFHKGLKDNIHLSLVGNRAILATIFNDQTTIGMVQLYHKEASEKIEKIFEISEKKPRKPTKLHEDFGKDAKQKLDDFFGI
jgi:predicted regulator of Ras-like GTPase activity (Roadblock/LC7/MglB family)